MENMDVVENSSQEQVAPVTTEQNTSQAVSQADKQEYNWRAVREREKEREQEIRRLRELNDRLLQASLDKPSQVVERDELDEIPDDDFLPKKQQRKLVQKETQHLKQEIESLKQSIEQQRQAQMLASLRTQYSDFSDVVTQENLARFEIQEPELAKTIAESKDPYKVLMQSYKFIKALGIGNPDSSKRAKEIEKRIEQNEKTVPSPLAFDKRPMAQAFKMTSDKEEQKKLYQEMMGFAQQAGFGY